MTKPSPDLQRLPMPIAAMGPWYFWAAPDAVGLSPDDAAAISSCSASDEQKRRAFELGMAARDALLRAPVGEAFGAKPS